MKKLIKTLALTGGILCVVKGLDDRLETTHYMMESPKIPEEFNGFRILQISDYHADSIPGLTDEIRNEAPDIIVSTGDLVHDRGSYAPGVRLCERLVTIAPVYAVTGNHDLWRNDYHEFEAELTALGVKTLHDERIELEKNGAKIGLAGIEDPFTQDSEHIKSKIKRSLKNLPKYDGYDILLFHRANWLDLFKNQGFDLILSGHMHGGQFRLPVGGKGVVAPKSGWSGERLFFPKYFAGHYKSTQTQMIVNRGVGNPMIIPRLFNRPEITVVTLKHSDK
jgi:hypothetical protein